MSNLFILGNGFDLAHGIPTTYQSFRSWILEQFPDSLVFRDTTISYEDYAQLPVVEFAAEVLIYAMDHAAGENWYDFEDALSRINFFDKLPGPTDEEDNEDDPNHDKKFAQYMLRVDALSSGIIYSVKEFWPILFEEWIKSVERRIENKGFTPRSNLKSLFSDASNKYMTFNYTKTLQHLYGIHVVKHIHNRVGQTLIFGHGDDRAEYEEPFERDMRHPIKSSFLDDLIQCLRKDTDKQLRKYSDFFKKLDKNIDKVYSYGFSYSTVDSPYIKEVIRHISPDATWHFTSYESNNKNELRIKKIKLRRYGFKGSFDVFDG